MNSSIPGLFWPAVSGLLAPSPRRLFPAPRSGPFSGTNPPGNGECSRKDKGRIGEYFSVVLGLAASWSRVSLSESLRPLKTGRGGLSDPDKAPLWAAHVAGTATVSPPTGRLSFPQGGQTVTSRRDRAVSPRVPVVARVGRPCRTGRRPSSLLSRLRVCRGDVVARWNIRRGSSRLQRKNFC